MKLNATLVGISAYSPSKPLIHPDRTAGEDWEQHSIRTWKEHLHTNSKGQVVISSFALKAMMDSIAKYLGEKIPGQGQKTYTALFKASIIVKGIDGEHPLLKVNNTPIHLDDVILEKHGEWVYCHADGKRGGNGARVNRLFPKFENWSIDIEIESIDGRITEDLLIRYLAEAGMKNGLGRFRPQNGGTLGRFKVFVNGNEAKVELSTNTPD